MSITETRRAPLVDSKFAKRWVWINGAVPAVVLAWDAYQGQLGVNEVNYALRTTGKLSLVFLVLALLVTPLRKLTGWAWLVGARRSLGLYGFFYALAHFAIFFAFDRDMSLGSTITELVERTYLWFGFAAIVFMIPLAVTSTDNMVTRLGPKRWKRLHRLAYPATIAAIVHFYMLVKADVTQPAAFAIVTGGLLAYRGVAWALDRRRPKPIARTASTRPKFWKGELVVDRITPETHDVKTFRLAMPDGAPLPFQHVPGQYLNIVLDVDGKRVPRSYTIASAPRPDSCEISVKRAADGYASHFLHDRVKVGDRVSIAAPAGKFVFAGHESERVILVAGGIGITPMMAVARALAARKWTGEIYLLFSVKRAADIVFRDEIAALQEQLPSLRVRIALTQAGDDDWTGARGHLTADAVRDFIPTLTGSQVLLCGPDAMMTAMRALFRELGVADSAIHQEAFISPTTKADGSGGVLEVVDDAIPASVQFVKSKRAADAPRSLTILEAAEEVGVEIPYECRSGICGQCKTKVVSGKVTMDSTDALTSSDRAKGLVLACQARCNGDVVVDA